MVCEIWFVHTPSFYSHSHYYLDLSIEGKVTFCLPCLMLWVYISKLVLYDQYLAPFDHELENQGCILFCIDAYAANHEAA